MTSETEADWSRLFELYRDYIKHEDGLIYHRLSAMMLFNGLAFAAYTTLAAQLTGRFWSYQLLTLRTKAVLPTLALLDQQLLLIVVLYGIALLGLVNSFYGACDVSAAQFAIDSLKRRWQELQRIALPNQPPAGEESKVSTLTLLRYGLRRDPAIIDSCIDRTKRVPKYAPNLTFGLAIRRRYLSNYALHSCFGILLLWAILLFGASSVVLAKYVAARGNIIEIMEERGQLPL